MRVDVRSRPKKSGNIVFRKIEDEYILVPMLASSDEVEHIFNLNKIGADIWEKIDGKKLVGEIINELIGEYDAEPDRIEKEVLLFLRDVSAAGIVEISHEDG